MAMPRPGRQRNAGVHHRHAAAADRTHGRGAVGPGDLGHLADRVGEFFRAWAGPARHGALGQPAVADFATLGGADAADLAGAEGRQVVVVEVPLGLHRAERVDFFPSIEHVEGGDAEDLGLAALEQAGTVDQGQVVALDHDGTDLGGAAAVDALTGLYNHATHGGLLKLLRFTGLALPTELLLLGELGLNGLLELGDLVLTGQLVGVAQGGGHSVVVGEDAVVDLLDRLVERVLALNDGAVDALPFLDELELSVAEGADGLLAELHGGEHVLLGDLLGAGLDHGDEVSRVPASSRSRSEFSRSS